MQNSIEVQKNLVVPRWRLKPKLKQHMILFYCPSCMGSVNGQINASATQIRGYIELTCMYGCSDVHLNIWIENIFVRKAEIFQSHSQTCQKREEALAIVGPAAIPTCQTCEQELYRALLKCASHCRFVKKISCEPAVLLSVVWLQFYRWSDGFISEVGEFASRLRESANN